MLLRFIRIAAAFFVRGPDRHDPKSNASNRPLKRHRIERTFLAIGGLESNQ